MSPPRVNIHLLAAAGASQAALSRLYSAACSADRRLTMASLVHIVSVVAAVLAILVLQVRELVIRVCDGWPRSE